MESFKEYLTESTQASTKFENVLVDCWNQGTLSKKTFYKKILTEKGVAEFLALKASGWGTTGKTSVQQKQILWNLSQLLHKKINLKSTEKAQPAGSRKLGVSTFWNSGTVDKVHLDGFQGTEKALDTSKADIIIGNEGISVKGPSARLMSGEQKEAQATVISALDYTKGNKVLKKKLLAEVDQFITNTKTYGVSPVTGKDLTATELKKTDRSVLSKSNQDAKDLLDQQKVIKDNADGVFKEAFNTPAVRNAFAWESMTGWEKFGGKTYSDPGDGKKGRATAMLVWSYDMKKIIYHHIKPSLPYVATIAKKMTMRADIKSGSRSQVKTDPITGDKIEIKTGYTFYQTVQLTYETVFEKTKGANEAYNNAVDKQHMLLAEGKIDEFKLRRTLGKMKDWLVSKITQAWAWAGMMMTKLKKRVVEILQKSMDVIMNFFDVEVYVKVKTTVKMT